MEKRQFPKYSSNWQSRTKQLQNTKHARFGRVWLNHFNVPYQIWKITHDLRSTTTDGGQRPVTIVHNVHFVIRYAYGTCTCKTLLESYNVQCSSLNYSIGGRNRILSALMIKVGRVETYKEYPLLILKNNLRKLYHQLTFETVTIFVRKMKDNHKIFNKYIELWPTTTQHVLFWVHYITFLGSLNTRLTMPGNMKALHRTYRTSFLSVYIRCIYNWDLK